MQNNSKNRENFSGIKIFSIAREKVLKSSYFFEKAEITIVIDVTETEIEIPQRKQTKLPCQKEKTY